MKRYLKKKREYSLKSIDAIFGLISAKNDSGIDELFEDIGNKYLESKKSPRC